MMGILYQLQMKNPYSDFWKLNIAPQKNENISYDVHRSLPCHDAWNVMLHLMPLVLDMGH